MWFVVHSKGNHMYMMYYGSAASRIHYVQPRQCPKKLQKLHIVVTVERDVGTVHNRQFSISELWERNSAS